MTRIARPAAWPFAVATLLFALTACNKDAKDTDETSEAKDDKEETSTEKAEAAASASASASAEEQAEADDPPTPSPATTNTTTKVVAGTQESVAQPPGVAPLSPAGASTGSSALAPKPGPQPAPQPTGPAIAPAGRRGAGSDSGGQCPCRRGLVCCSGVCKASCS